MLSRWVRLGFVGPRTTIRYFGRSFGPLSVGRPTRPPFDRDQNEDGFMIVGRGTEPSALRPNLIDSASTTSDENWARILEDVDPPSSHLLHQARALRPGFVSALPFKQYRATQTELRAMESLLERVFDITAPANAQSSSLGARRNNISSNPSARRLGGYTESDPEIEFDKKREEMFKCQTDQEVLQWAMQEVFLRAPGESTSPTASSGIPSNDISTTLGEMHPKIYGRIIASLMKEFREQYNNPHLATAIFDYARRLSIISYVTGCTSPSYNELMRTHWCSFRNLRAVVDVAEEMQVNGVLPDQITAALLNQIHDEVEPQAVWTEDGDDAEANKLLNRLDELLRLSEYEPIAPLNERKRYGKTPRRTTDGHRWSSRSFGGADSI